MAARRNRPSGAKRLVFTIVYYGERNRFIMSEEVITTSTHAAEDRARKSMPPEAVRFTVFDQADEIRAASTLVAGELWQVLHSSRKKA